MGILALLQARIDKIRGDVGELWIVVVMRIADRGLVFFRQRDELRHGEGRVAHFESMAQRQAFLLVRQQFQKALEIVRLEFFRRRELPHDRTQLVGPFLQPLREELAHRLGSLGQHLAVGDKTIALNRKDKTLRRFGVPFGVSCRA